jgi:hypothetical protein
MTDRDPPDLNARLQMILQSALVEIRNLALSGQCEQIHDLADATEFIPRLLLTWDDQQAALVRPSLEQYESKYPQSRCRYTGILDMEGRQFSEMFLSFAGAWGEVERR